MHDPPLPFGCGVTSTAADNTSRQTHYFESPMHLETVVQCICDGVLPLRFAYAGSAAYTHDRLAQTPGYQSVIGSVELEVATLVKAGLPTGDLSHIIDIGPGNGVHTVALLRSLGAIGMNFRSYLGLDFSATLLAIASSRIRAAFGLSIAVSCDIWDIESDRCESVERWRAASGDPAPLLVCLLGHTLGNLEGDATALANVYDSLRVGDVLLAGLSLRHPSIDETSVLAPYLNDVFHAAALEPLWAAGIDPYDVEFHVRFADGAVIGEAKFIRSVRVGASMLPPGHTVRCFSSRRFAMEDALLLFRGAGWIVRSAVVDDRSEHAVVMAVRGMS